VLGPSVADVLSEADGPVTLVPLFLASGYHVQTDIPAAVTEAGRSDITVTPALGPDPALIDVAFDRLRAAGANLADRHSAAHPSTAVRPSGLPGAHSADGVVPGVRSVDGVVFGAHSDDGVVLAAAGSADPRAIADVERAAQLLGAPAGFIATASPSVAAVVQSVRTRRSHGRVAIASWLLAPGFFHTQLAGAGADIVAEPLGAHPAVADLIVRRATDMSLAARGPAAGEP
jgi:sirohydrochlorin ferrochelatase